MAAIIQTESLSFTYPASGERLALPVFEDLTLDDDLLSTLANNGCALEASSLVEENAPDLDKYGLLPVNRVQVLFMNEPFNEVINDEDGMYLTEPTADERGLYQAPEFVFTHKHIFKTNRVYTASRKVL